MAAAAVATAAMVCSRRLVALVACGGSPTAAFEVTPNVDLRGLRSFKGFEPLTCQ